MRLPFVLYLIYFYIGLSLSRPVTPEPRRVSEKGTEHFVSSISSVDLTWHPDASSHLHPQRPTIFQQISQVVIAESTLFTHRSPYYKGISYINTNLDINESSGQTCFMALSESTLENSIVARIQTIQDVEKHFDDLLMDGVWDGQQEKYTIESMTEELTSSKMEREDVVTKTYRRIEDVTFYADVPSGKYKSVTRKMLNILWKSYLYFSVFVDQPPAVSWREVVQLLAKTRHHYNPLRAGSYRDIVGYYIPFTRIEQRIIEVPEYRYLKCYEPKQGYTWNSTIDGPIDKYVDQYEVRSRVKDTRGLPFEISMRTYPKKKSEYETG